MLESVRRAIIDHVLVVPGDHVLVAVSGGADSVCLLHVLLDLAPELEIKVLAAHFDHRLRPESGTDAAFVRDLCARLQVPLTSGAADVAAEARRRRRGIEETGRSLRRGFLLGVAHDCGCRRIALGHHRGDQAETVLHRLLRGSGASGLAGMRLLDAPFIRPLLPVSRPQILAYLQRRRLSWIEDASNSDVAFTRNRLRHRVLPLLAEFNPRIEAHLARLGGLIALEEDFWAQQSAAALAALSQSDGEGLSLDCRRLRALHPALRARVLRDALAQVRGDLQRIEAVHLMQIEALLRQQRPQGESHLPGAWVGRRYGRLWLRRSPPSEVPAVEVAIPGPGLFAIPGGRLEVTIEPAARGEDSLAVEFDPEAVRFPLRVRHPRAGDRFSPAGMNGRKKLKDFFIDAKLDREVRQRVLLVEGEDILWLIGHRRSAGREPGTGTVLRLRFHSGPG